MTEQSDTRGRLQSQRVAESIADKIREGELKHGERLSSEAELAKQYGVARGTMRSALGILKAQNLVQTRPGVGSFVAYHGRSLEGTRGWTAASAEAGAPTHTEILSCDRIKTPQDVLDLGCTSDHVYRIVRRRSTPEAPVSIETSCLPANEILDLIMERGLLGGSISVTMQAAGLRAESGHQDISVGKMPNTIEELLGADHGDRFLIAKRASYDGDGDLVEYVVSYLHPDHFSWHIEFGQGRDNEN